MASGFGELASEEPESISYFECNICLELPQEPIASSCGHLFCWPCLYKRLHVHHHSECPVCEATIEEEKLVPLYGRGKSTPDPRSRSVLGVQIPNRPTGQRPATAPQPDLNQFPPANPWFAGGAPVPAGGARFGNYTFSAAIGGLGGLFPMLNFQVHGFPEAVQYGNATGYPYGYANPFHGGHAHGYQRPMSQGQQTDVLLRALLILVCALVVATLIWF